MEGKTKKMVLHEKEIARLEINIEECNRLIAALMGFKPVSKAAEEAKAQEIDNFQGLIAQHSTNVKIATEQLELATVAMLAGKDVEFNEPTPVDALRSA